MIYQSFFRF